DQHACAIRTNPSQLLKPHSLVRTWEAGIFSGKRFRAVRLYLFDLPIQQRKALKTALDLAPQVRRQHPAIARAHAVQLGSPVSAF
ncbi:hypothetical protein, partial [Clostridium perfringens]